MVRSAGGDCAARRPGRRVTGSERPAGEASDPSDCALDAPRRNSLVPGGRLAVRGSFMARAPVAAVVVLIGGVERARGAPRRGGRRSDYAFDIDVSGLACRLGVEIVAERGDGATVPLHKLTVWRPAYRPETARYAVVAVEAAHDGATVAGVVRSEAPLDRLELRSPAERRDVALDAGGRFRAAAAGDDELWAVFGGALRPDLHLGRVAGGGTDDASPDPVAHVFQPMRTTLAAVAAGARTALTFRDGRREETSVQRMAPAGDDWALVAGDGDDLRTVSVRDVARMESAPGPFAPASPEVLKAHLRALGKPAPTMRLDAELPFEGVALPVLGPRRPPPTIDRVVLIRPGAHPTDQLYVLAPLAPLLAARGVALETVSLDDRAGTARALDTLSLDANTVVVVSRSADDGWLDRLSRERAPFVVYLMDDDPLTAADSEGLYHRYRRRVIEIATADFPVLLRRCDRFLVSSPALAARYASSKTVLMEPPFIRPAPSLAHHDDVSTVRIAYHGTGIHAQDIEFLFSTIAKALKGDPRLRFQLVSGQPTPKTLKELANFELVKPMPWPDYVAFAAANPAHLSLAPMLDTPFNAGKSIVKLLDAASLGAAGVYSRIAPYRDLVTDGVDGFLADNDPADWVRILKRVAAAPKRLKPIALAAQETATRRAALGRATAIWRSMLGFD